MASARGTLGKKSLDSSLSASKVKHWECTLSRGKEEFPRLPDLTWSSRMGIVKTLTSPGGIRLSCRYGLPNPGSRMQGGHGPSISRFDLSITTFTIQTSEGGRARRKNCQDLQSNPLNLPPKRPIVTARDAVPPCISPPPSSPIRSHHYFLGPTGLITVSLWIHDSLVYYRKVYRGSATALGGIRCLRGRNRPLHPP